MKNPHAFQEWLEKSDVLLPTDPVYRRHFIEAMSRAFTGGYHTRKKEEVEALESR